MEEAIEGWPIGETCEYYHEIDSAEAPEIAAFVGKALTHLITDRGREASAQALRDAAERWDSLQTKENNHYSRRDAALWLIREADRIERNHS